MLSDLEPEELRVAVWTDDRHELRKRAGRRAGKGHWAEFGTASGTSARDLLSVLPEGVTLYLHDTWTGLPAAWDKGNKVIPVGAFACPPPQLPRTVNRRGLFSATLPFDFGPLGLVHIDCDLYEGARDVLFGCDANIVDGTVLMFDELSSIKYPNWRQGEYRALCEWREATGKRVEWLGASIGSAYGVVKC